MKLLGGKWPRDYVCFDLETSGFAKKSDVIVEWGHCIVRDCKVVKKLGMVINWYGSGLLEYGDGGLTRRLQRVREGMAADGRTFRITPAVMRKEGVSPEVALPWMFEFLSMLQSQEEMLVVHNGWKFDIEMIENHFLNCMGERFEFDPNRVIDTGAIEKASQIFDDYRAVPQPGETLKDYFLRIANWRLPGVKWNLDTWCMEKYDLAGKYGADPEKAHTAEHDAWLLHLLMEEFRERMTAAPPPDVSPPAEPQVPKGRKNRSGKKKKKPDPFRRRRRGQRKS
jgi:DNA polymerase III epsilon subunit-like protein